MILISHRGNLSGKILEAENKPEYIDEALNLGYEVEVDIWFYNSLLWLGHDEPQYKIDRDWLDSRGDKLWIHCKNVGALEWFKSNPVFNYFWHETDTVTITSKGFLWAYPGKQPILGSIAVLPETYNDDVSKCIGVCSDYVQNYKS